jgi:formylglycine-generating enzyme required for sulfatase activity
MDVDSPASRIVGALIPSLLQVAATLLAVVASAPEDAASATASAGPDTFRDCPDCVLMKVIPPGRFLMGSPENEAGRQANEGPRHPLSIAHPFALGVYDITVAEYARFVQATGYAPQNPRCDWRNPKVGGSTLKQSAEEPVVCVNWADATAFIGWLSARSGHAYRLPSEAEWEYAARAGSTSARPWGPQADPDRANTGADKCCAPHTDKGDRWLYTSPVGSFPPNAFGLYDMIGNVWQWTVDCGTDNYGSKATLTRKPTSCATHAIRGGGWFHPPEMARSAARVIDDSDLRVADIGFRVARTLSNF